MLAFLEDPRFEVEAARRIDGSGPGRVIARLAIAQHRARRRVRGLEVAMAGVRRRRRHASAVRPSVMLERARRLQIGRVTIPVSESGSFRWRHVDPGDVYAAGISGSMTVMRVELSSVPGPKYAARIRMVSHIGQPARQSHTRGRRTVTRPLRGGSAEEKEKVLAHIFSSDTWEDCGRKICWHLGRAVRPRASRPDLGRA